MRFVLWKPEPLTLEGFKSDLEQALEAAARKLIADKYPKLQGDLTIRVWFEDIEVEGKSSS